MKWPPEIGIAPYYSDEFVCIYHGDCKEILPLLPEIELCLTDPPYGMNYNPRRRRKNSHVLKGLHLKDRGWKQIKGEKNPFDPHPFLSFPQVILWGANHYADKLPSSKMWLVWDKREGTTSDNQSDCELAWVKRGGRAMIYRQLWRGVIREGIENIAISGSKLHPHQKPIGLMMWCIELSKTTGIILDPYAGSCTTARVAKNLNRYCICIEIEEQYCEIGARRMGQEVINYEQNNANQRA